MPLDVPAAFLYGGTTIPGTLRGRRVSGGEVVDDIGKVAAGELTEAELHELEAAACPAAGSCGATAVAALAAVPQGRAVAAGARAPP